MGAGGRLQIERDASTVCKEGSTVTASARSGWIGFSPASRYANPSSSATGSVSRNTCAIGRQAALALPSKTSSR